MDRSFNVNRKDETLSWQVICQRIKLGFDLQEVEGELTAQQIVEFNDAIVIDPDYQREYRSSVYDESTLIESALLDIPIPPIFLASHKYRGVQVLNVVDGQHRLRAFYRYINNSYALRGLLLLSEFNDRKFDDLQIEDRVSLMSKGITAITFRDFPGKEFELEIFNRYNKGTKPLTPQEIRHAVFDSKVNDLVNVFSSKLMRESKSTLSKAYAVSKDRFQKKTCQENIFVILSIIENGIIQEFKNEKGIIQKIQKSPQYAESFMKEKSENDTEESYHIAANNLHRFNEFIEALCVFTEFPFSREIYGISQRGNKFQVSLSMILAGIFRRLIHQGYDFSLLQDTEYLNMFRKYLEHFLSESYLEDPEYRASTTNPMKIDELVNTFNVQDYA